MKKQKYLKITIEKVTEKGYWIIVKFKLENELINKNEVKLSKNNFYLPHHYKKCITK